MARALDRGYLELPQRRNPALAAFRLRRRLLHFMHSLSNTTAGASSLFVKRDAREGGSLLPLFIYLSHRGAVCYYCHFPHVPLHPVKTMGDDFRMKILHTHILSSALSHSCGGHDRMPLYELDPLKWDCFSLQDASRSCDIASKGSAPAFMHQNVHVHNYLYLLVLARNGSNRIPSNLNYSDFFGYLNFLKRYS